MAMTGLEMGLLNAGGASLGGLASGMFGGGGLFGKKEQFKQVPTYSPQQMQALNWLTQQGMQNTNFDAIESQARRGFQENTLPMLAERFTSMGGQGALGSSGFARTLGMAGTGLESDLAAMRANYGMQQLGMGLRPQFENVYQPRKPGGLEQSFGGIASLLPLLAFL